MVETPDSSRYGTKRIAELIARRSAELMAIPGVHGVAEGRTADGVPCLLILVQDSRSPAVRALPHELEGIPVRLDVTDSIRAIGHQGRPRPL